MKTLVAATLAFALTPAWGQAVEFDFDFFDALAAKAKNKTEVTLSGDLLKTALSLAKSTNKDKDVPEISLDGLVQVVVRSFEFDTEGAYQDSDLEPLRRQVGAGTGWSRIVDAQENGDHSEIYVLSQGGQFGGLLIIAAEKKELTVVHVQGTLQLAELASLQELVQSNIQFDLSKLQGQ